MYKIDKDIFYKELEKLFDAFLKLPLLQPIVLWQKEDTDYNGITLKNIQEKVLSQKYISPMDFAFDIRLLFSNARKHFLNEKFKYLSTIQVEQWIEKHIQKLPISQEDVDKLKIAKVQKIIHKVNLCINYNQFYYPRPISTILRTDMISSENVCAHRILSEFHQTIDKLDEKTLFDIIQVLKKYIPDINIDSNVSIPFDKIPPECLAEIENLNISIQDRIKVLPSRSDTSK